MDYHPAVPHIPMSDQEIYLSIRTQILIEAYVVTRQSLGKFSTTDGAMSLLFTHKSFFLPCFIMLDMLILKSITLEVSLYLTTAQFNAHLICAFNLPLSWKFAKMAHYIVLSEFSWEISAVTSRSVDLLYYNFRISHISLTEEVLYLKFLSHVFLVSFILFNMTF